MTDNQLSRERQGTIAGALFVLLLTPCFCFQALGSSILNFPRLVLDSGVITGIAVVNPNPTPAEVVLTVYDSRGAPILAEGFQNPVALQIEAGGQFAKTAAEVFGPVVLDTEAAWVQGISVSEDLTGFFLVLDTAISFLDGADLPAASRRLILEDLRTSQGFETELNLVNPNPDHNIVQIRDLSTDSLWTELEIAPMAAMRLALPLSELEGEPVPRAVRIDGSRPLIAQAFVKGSEDWLGLNARPEESATSALFFPQFAVLGGFETSARVSNVGLTELVITLTIYQPDGQPFQSPAVTASTISLPLGPRATETFDVTTLFGFSGESSVAGWLAIQTTEPSLIGSLSYSLNSALAAVVGSGTGASNYLFSHIATTQDFFTGVAYLNPGQTVLNLDIVALAQDGSLLGQDQIVLGPRQRESRLIQELIADADQQAGGLVLTRADGEFHATSLFGSISKAALANVPAQETSENFEVEAALPRIEVGPAPDLSLPVSVATAVIANTQTGDPQWSVNEVAGGNSEVGTVESIPGPVGFSAALYSAPDTPPIQQPLVLRVTEDDREAGMAVWVHDPPQDEYAVQYSLTAFAQAGDGGRIFAIGDPIGPAPAQGAGSTVLELEGDSAKVVRELAFLAQDLVYVQLRGIDYLLILDSSAGRIHWLTGFSYPLRIASGFDQPSSLVVDHWSQKLLVAESGGVSAFPIEDLRRFPSGPYQRLIEAQGIRDLAVDSCTGDIYYVVQSDPDWSTWRYDRKSHQSERLFGGGQDSQRIELLHHSGASCENPPVLLVAFNESGGVIVFSSEPGRPPKFDGQFGLEGEFLAMAARRIQDFHWLGSDNPLNGKESLVFLTRPQIEPAGPDSGSTIVTLDTQGQFSPSPSVLAIPPACFDFLAPFDDSHVEAAVRAGTGVGGGPIPCDAVEFVTSLQVAGASRLGGIEQLINLRTLRLLPFEGSNLEPLSGLPALESLSVAATSLPSDVLDDLVGLRTLNSLSLTGLPSDCSMDLTPLQNLPFLESLSFSLNATGDLGPLSFLTRLKSFGTGGDCISDLGPLAGLVDLEELTILRSSVADLSPLAGLGKLREINLDLSQVQNLSPLAGLSNLEDLLLFQNPLSSLAPLAGLTKLKRLEITDTGTSDLSPLAGLTSLIALSAASTSLVEPERQNKITDLSPLAGLVNLIALTVSGNPIQSLSPLANLRELSSLRISNSQVTDLSPIQNLDKLRELLAFASGVSQLGDLPKSLEIVDLSRNNITSIQGLSGLQKLRILSLQDNQITSLGPLASSGELVSLNLQDNLITQLDAIQSLTNLTFLNVQGNAWESLAPLAANPGLGDGDVIVLGNCLAAGFCPAISGLLADGATVNYSVVKDGIPPTCGPCSP